MSQLRVVREILSVVEKAHTLDSLFPECSPEASAPQVRSLTDWSLALASDP